MSSKNLLESILSALSNEVRAEVLKLISREGPLSFTEIMEKLEMNPKTDAGKFGYHLRMLTEAELLLADEASGKYYLTVLGQDVGNFIYGVEDAVRRKKGEMLVRTSSLTIEPFERKKIVEALIREANVPRKLAESISKETEDRLKKPQLRYLTAALIREYVNAILLEKGLEEYRHSLTRLGQPVYDVTSAIKSAGYKDYPSPERVHAQAGDAVFEEYMYLKILPRTIADAHLSGAIHINNANFWVLRPADLQHDVRPFLRGKLPSDGTGLSIPAHPTPRSLKGALFTIGSLLQSSSAFVSNAQSIGFFNVFLAPYVKELKEIEIKNSLRDFLYSLNEKFNGISNSSIAFNLELEIPEFLEKVKATGPDGEKGYYGDYSDQALRLLGALIDLMNESDGAAKPLLNPSLFIKMRKRAITSNAANECMMKAYELAERWGNVFFANQSLPWQTENVSYNSTLSRIDSSWKDWESGTIRVGSLDNITINLPRIAYESKGDDDKFSEKLKEMLELAKESLVIKRQVLSDRIQTDSLLPLFRAEIDGTNYFRLGDSPGIISYVGLPEAVKYHTGLDTADSEDALRFATKVIGQMGDYTASQPSIRLLSSSITFEPSAQRLTNLDIAAGHLKSKEAGCYTEHSNLPLSVAIPLKTRLKMEEIFQQTTRGGHLFDIRLSEPFPTDNLLANYTKRMFETTNIGLLTFTRDYIYCFHCRTVTYGFHTKCPKCAYDGNKLVLYTKTFGRYKSSKAWSVGEREYAFSTKRSTL